MGNYLNEGDGEKEKEKQSKSEMKKSVEVWARSRGAGEKKGNQIGMRPGNALFENQLQREWLTTEEAAFFLAVSVGALRNMVYRDQIVSYRVGRRVRFRVEDCKRLFVRMGEA